MTGFLNNLVRRGAGLRPAIAPRPAVPSPSSPSAEAAVTAAPADRGSGRVSAADDSAQDRRAVPGERTVEVHAPGIAEQRPASAPAPTPVATAGPVRHEAPTLRPAWEAPAAAMAHPDARTPPEPPRLSHPAVDRDHDAIVTPAPVQTPAASRPADSAPAVATRVEPSRAHSAIRTVAPQPQQSRPDAHEVRPAPVVRPAVTPPATRSAAPDVAPTAARDVQVRIGKVEIRASQPAAPPARAAQPKGSTGFVELALARAHLNRNYR